MFHTQTRTGRPVLFVTDYADQTDPPADDAETTLVIPEDLTSLSGEEIAALAASADEAFTALYDGGAGATPENMPTLRVLTEGIEALATRQAELDAEAATLAAEAAELAARVNPNFAAEGDGEEGDPEAEPEAPAEDAPAEDAPVEDAPAEDAELVSVTASARKEVRVNLGNINRNRTAQLTTHQSRNYQAAESMSDLVTAATDLPVVGGQSVDSWNQIAQGLERRLQGFNISQFEQAQRQGKHIRSQQGVAVINKPFDPRLIVRSDDQEHVDSVIRLAMDETRLPGGSLVASGGWCAPSETVYDLCELESRDGILSLPEIGISRGGLRHPENGGPSFQSIYTDTGFSYTEQQDIDGDYDGNGGGSKPCFKVECPPFVDDRLNLDGVCITAGLLQSRGYPEAIARLIRGSLVAHDHRMNANVINALVNGSTAVAMVASQVGTTAPLLTAIELQAEHYKASSRMARSTTLEAVFPFWVRGAIRADLARRQGVDLLDVSDARIQSWFMQRGINAQFVYDWQGIETTAASAFDQFPTSVDFLLYSAGTWVKGGAEVITLDHVYDSVLLGTNDYTALFSEEGWLAAKMCQDSRVITVPVCATGETGAGVSIDCDGTAAA